MPIGFLHLGGVVRGVHERQHHPAWRRSGSLASARASVERGVGGRHPRRCSLAGVAAGTYAGHAMWRGGRKQGAVLALVTAAAGGLPRCCMHAAACRCCRLAMPCDAGDGRRERNVRKKGRGPASGVTYMTEHGGQGRRADRHRPSPAARRSGLVASHWCNGPALLAGSFLGAAAVARLPRSDAVWRWRPMWPAAVVCGRLHACAGLTTCP